MKHFFDSLLDWNLWGNYNPNLKEREVSLFIPSKTILVVKGVRRSGKSSLTYLLAQEKFSSEQTLFINFEDPRLKFIEAREVLNIIDEYRKEVYERGPKLLVLDEVQNLNGWENLVRLIHETTKTKIIVTGSSSKLMSLEYASSLSGRHVDIEIFPLSFLEFLKWKNVKTTKLELAKNKIKVDKLFRNYIQYGGFPAVVLTKNTLEKKLLLRGYFEDILIKDVVRRFNIKEINKIEKLAMLFLTNISTIQSFNKLKKYTSLSLDTVERYAKYFEISRIFFFIPKIDFSLKKQILTPKKVYTIDLGLYSALGFKFSQNLGRILENLVSIELLRRKSYFHTNWEIFYWRDYQGREVDFVIKEGTRVKELIQVTYASGKDEIKNREIESLIKASEIFNCKNLTLISWNYEEIIDYERKNIRVIPIKKWLLNIY